MDSKHRQTFAVTNRHSGNHEAATKKREEKAHKNEKAENYYSYADTIGKNLAFIPFTNVHYKLEKPKSGIVVFFTKKNEILVATVAVKREE